MHKHDGTVGTQFPELGGKTLSGKEVVFPGSVGGLLTFLAGCIDGGMRGGIPDGRHDHVVTYYGKLGLYTGALRMKDRSLCHSFLRERKGVIRWTGNENALEAEAVPMPMCRPRRVGGQAGFY
jgi:hypothetical protein